MHATCLKKIKKKTPVTNKFRQHLQLLTNTKPKEHKRPCQSRNMTNLFSRHSRAPESVLISKIKLNQQ